MSKFTSKPDKFGKTPYSPSNSVEIQVAYFIAGCLAASDLLNVDPGNEFYEGRFDWVVRLIAVCLEQVIPPGSDHFDLPLNDKMPWRQESSNAQPQPEAQGDTLSIAEKLMIAEWRRGDIVAALKVVFAK